MISVGAIAFSFIPILKNGVWGMVAFMAMADGLSGVFFFVFFFAGLIALFLASLGWAVLESLESPPSLAWVVGIPALIGAMLLPPVWLLDGRLSDPFVLVGPALLGAIAGAAAGAVFCRIAMVPRPALVSGEGARPSPA